MNEGELRTTIGAARRVVVKIGSSALTSVEGGIDRVRLSALADAIEGRMQAGSDVVVVSSGAIGAGIAPLGLRSRPRDLATKQAAASVGQLELATAWGEAFSRYHRTVGQVLLTAGDIGRRSSARNAQRTLDRLRALAAVPLINENDTVATDEIRFGDNDRLAALVAHLVGADALFLLSDVDCLYDADPRKSDANRVPFVGSARELDGVVAGSGGALGTGGMASKLAAATLAADAGIPVLLTAASRAGEALAAEPELGTVFAARPERMSARKFWVRHAADAHGVVVIDDGAAHAVKQRGSLLSAGVCGVEGGFHGGDVVELRSMDGAVIGRGICAYGVADLRRMLTEREQEGELGDDQARRLEPRASSTTRVDGRPVRAVIHADDLVL